jgi:hypothetical protein
MAVQRSRLDHHRYRRQAPVAGSVKTPACNARVGAMPGDPNECRIHALNCVRLAEKAISASDREHLLGLAQTWRRLADELEATQYLFDAINALGPRSETAELD